MPSVFFLRAAVWVKTVHGKKKNRCLSLRLCLSLCLEGSRQRGSGVRWVQCVGVVCGGGGVRVCVCVCVCLCVCVCVRLCVSVCLLLDVLARDGLDERL